MSELAAPTVLVADDDEDIRELVCVVLRDGADYFLPKPFGMQDLLRRVTELLSAGAPA